MHIVSIYSARPFYLLLRIVSIYYARPLYLLLRILSIYLCLIVLAL
jgi:hypothetical protein